MKKPAVLAALFALLVLTSLAFSLTPFLVEDAFGAVCGHFTCPNEELRQRGYKW